MTDVIEAMLAIIIGILLAVFFPTLFGVISAIVVGVIIIGIFLYCLERLLETIKELVIYIYQDYGLHRFVRDIILGLISVAGVWLLLLSLA